ncbi:MAG: M15 family metallopeptidase [Clostridium sp.]|uniref:M15 family metallopeptidase n=1 Tax=Clostridium sp. TaxID=1506 RepID=UPI0030756752
MKLIMRGILILSIFVTVGIHVADADEIEESSNRSDKSYEVIMKQDILSLMMAYPEYISAVEKSQDGKIFVITVSGKKILYDDKQKKNFNQKMDNSDLQDILEDIYPLESIYKLLEVNSDPGRFRNYDLLNEVYGKSEGQVSKNLVGVPAPYNNYEFNKSNGAADSLRAVMVELKLLAKNNQSVASLISPINGTFNYRLIAGTGKLSPHAYGIAIDVRSNPSDYWKWATREAGEKRMLSYPKELVEVFEKYNFVWGGKWGHFDILHFEYRPEVVIKAKYFGGVVDEDQWFGSVIRDDNVNGYIEIINSVLGQ